MDLHKNTIKEVRLISNNCSTFYKPAYDEEVQQELTINDKGEVYLIGYNHEAVVEVEEIEYFSEEDVPLPIEKTKRIIRKYNQKIDKDRYKYA